MANKQRIMMAGEMLSLNDVVPRFVAAKIAEGVSEKTVKNYRQHLQCIGNHLDWIATALTFYSGHSIV